MENSKAAQESQETKRVYFQDSYQLEFEAHVLESFSLEGKPVVVLDQTCFYPESGGQPADRGTLNGIAVVHVAEESGKILHFLEKAISFGPARGKIDGRRRFDHMQQHTGQHILSQSFFELLAGETLSFHLGESVSTVEIGLAKISEEEAEGVERRANEIVFEDRPIKTCFLDQEKIKDIPLRKPPKKEGLIRVVEVEGFDYSACGGTHCNRTGEVGIIKMTKGERIRNNVRCEFLCGWRALEDYSQKNSDVRSLNNLLNVSNQDVVGSVEKMLQELKSSKKKMKKVQENLARYEAQDIVERAQGKVVRGVWGDKSSEEIKFLALNIIRLRECIVLYGLRGENHDHLIMARSSNINIDLREFLPLIFSIAKGKGGGSPSLVELVLEKSSDLEIILARVQDILKERGLD